MKKITVKIENIGKTTILLEDNLAHETYAKIIGILTEATKESLLKKDNTTNIQSKDTAYKKSYEESLKDANSIKIPLLTEVEPTWNYEEKLIFFRCDKCKKDQYKIEQEGTVVQCIKCTNSILLDDIRKVRYDCPCGHSDEVYTRGKDRTTVGCKSCREQVEIVYL